MCRTVHALLQTVICGIQMLVRVFMTVILMIENLIRMILQTLYNFVSFVLQMLSLIPICIVFLLTARLKCFMCGGGGPCPVNRGGACDCIMSALAILILFLIFRATGILDKIFYSLGYSKARPPVIKFVPTPGDITECSRNDTDYSDETTTFKDINLLTDFYTSILPVPNDRFITGFFDSSSSTFISPDGTVEKFRYTTSPSRLEKKQTSKGSHDESDEIPNEKPDGKPDATGSDQEPDGKGSHEKPDEIPDGKPDATGSDQEPDGKGSHEKPDEIPNEKPDEIPNEKPDEKPDGKGSDQESDEEIGQDPQILQSTPEAYRRFFTVPPKKSNRKFKWTTVLSYFG